jgi:hypothetical protein
MTRKWERESAIRKLAARSAASRSSFSRTCAYVSRKNPMLACPMRSLTIFGLTPPRIHACDRIGKPVLG